MNASKRIIGIILFLVLSCLLPGCSGCSKSGLRSNSGKKSNFRERTTETNYMKNVEGSSIQMENRNGVKYIWVEINRLKLKFIFDTGASNVCLSAAEATVLYRQGTLQNDDILNLQYFQDATGAISVGTRINIKTLKIGDRILENIEAIVIDNNQAPLLLGQSVLEKFGKITIDNDRTF